MSEDLRVSPVLVIPATQLQERFSRSSGPGGQGVNTTDSRVELSFDFARSPAVPPWLRHRMICRLQGRLVGGVLVVVASEHRAQLRNRAAARDRMAALLRDAAAAPAPARRPSRPTRGATERRLAHKKQRGVLKRGRRRGWDE